MVRLLRLCLLALIAVAALPGVACAGPAGAVAGAVAAMPCHEAAAAPTGGSQPDRHLPADRHVCFGCVLPIRLTASAAPRPGLPMQPVGSPSALLVDAFGPVETPPPRA